MRTGIEKVKIAEVFPDAVPHSGGMEYALVFHQGNKFPFLRTPFACPVPEVPKHEQVTQALFSIQKVLCNMLDHTVDPARRSAEVMAVWRDLENMSSDYLCGVEPLASILCSDGTRKDYYIRYVFTANAPGERIDKEYYYRNRHENGSFIVTSRHTGRISKEPIDYSVRWCSGYQAAVTALIRHLAKLRSIRVLPGRELNLKIRRLRETIRPE